MCVCVCVCVKVNGELSDSFDMGEGVLQGCVMSPWLVSVCMEGCMRGKKSSLGMKVQD